jgi:hypothetical protein
MRTIKLTDAQAELLERLLLNDLDEEFVFQADGDCNPVHYEAVLEILKAVYQPSGLTIGTPLIIQQREEELAEIRRKKQ